MDDKQHIRQAMVSLYSHATSTEVSHFVASGLFISPGVVLTAAHVFDNRPATNLWVRPQVDGARAMPLASDPVLHPELDAALVRIETHPQSATCLEVDRSNSEVLGSGYRLFGYVRGQWRFDDAPVREVRQFDAAERFYLVSPANTNGQSGGALCFGPRVWALVFGVVDDLTAPEGAVLAMHQLWEGFLEKVDGIAFIRSRQGRAAPPDGRDPPPPPAPQPEPAKPPRQTETAEQREITRQLKGLLRTMFLKPPLSDWQGAGQRGTDGIPDRALEALAQGPSERGKALVFWLCELQRSIEKAWALGEIQLERSRAPAVRLLLSECLGQACRLCMDPAQVEMARFLGERIRLPASTPVGAATYAWPKDPLGALLPSVGSAHKEVSYRYASTGLESGAGQDLRDSILSALATLRRQQESPRTVVRIRTQTDRDLVRGNFLADRDDGRQHCLIISRRHEPNENPQMSLSADDEKWLYSYGIQVLELTCETTGCFFFDEIYLSGKVRGFIHAFADHPAWKDTDVTA